MNLDLQRGEVRLVTGKTGRRQIIPMHPALRRHVDTLAAGDDPRVPASERRSRSSREKTRAAHSPVASVSYRRKPALPGQRSTARLVTPRLSGGACGKIGNQLPLSALYGDQPFLQLACVVQAVSQEIVGHDSEAMQGVYARINRARALAGAIARLPDVTSAIPPKARPVRERGGAKTGRNDTMIEFKVSCPSCDGHVQFPEEMSGQRVSCPHCGQALTDNQRARL